jgi:hypothetical protein
VLQKLEDAVTQFWLTESFGVNSPAHPPMSNEDNIFIDKGFYW